MVFNCTYCKRKCGKGITCFSFPKDNELCARWLMACGLEVHPQNDTSKLKLCSPHFNENFVLTRVGGPKILTTEAISTIFHKTKLKENLKNKAVNRKLSFTYDKPDIQPIATNSSHDQPSIEAGPSYSKAEATLSKIDKKLFVDKKKKIWGPRKAQEMQIQDFQTPRKAARNLRLMQQEIQLKEKTIKCLIQRNYRLKKKINNLENLIDHLKAKGLISESTANILEVMFSKMEQIIKRKMRKKKTAFTIEMKKFALTLQFHSTKAYKYIRKSFSNLLPHPRTLS